MDVKILKKHPDAVIPTYAHPTDAGLDLRAVTKSVDEFGNEVFGTGLAFEIPEGYVGLIFPRSSIFKKDLFLTNAVGVIDSGFRGEVTFKFKRTHNLECGDYEIGERIGQIIIVPYPKINFVEVDKLSDADRGERGYGSTGA